MTDLLKKEKIIGIICYIAYSAVLAYQRHSLISLVYFAVISLVIFFADKIIGCDVIKKKTLGAFFVTAIGFQTMFEIFFSAHVTAKMVLSAVAAGIFFACIFALTDTKKLLFCTLATPVLCFFNLKIAVCYSVLLLCNAVVNMQLQQYMPQKKKDKNKQGLSPEKLNIISAVVSVACIGVCVYLLLNLDGYVKENLSYMLLRFKNPPALIIASVYLAVKLFGSDFKAKSSIAVSLAVFIIATVFATIILGWSVFSLFCLTVPLFLGTVCIKNTKCIEAIKEDYNKNKFLFWALIICLLQ